MGFDGVGFGREVVEAVKSYLKRETSLLEQKITWLEQRISRLEGFEPPPKAVKPKPVVRISAGKAYTNGNGKAAQ